MGAKAGESATLELTFPEDYSNKELAGKEAKFEVEVKTVEEVVLPEMNQEFFSKYGITAESEDEFRGEVVKNMERELKQAVNGKLKQQIIDALVEQNEVDVPAAMVEQEINKMKQEAVQQFGGGQQMDLSQLPSELFKDQAESRVKTGLLFAALVKQNDIKADDAAVQAKIEEIAATYESPEEVTAYYSQPENRAQVEAVVVEEAVVEHVVANAKVKKKKMSYEDAVKPAAPKSASQEEA